MDRYTRQVTLIGTDAQARIRGARVGVIGAGGLGSPALLYLAAAGVGSIVLVDDDQVSTSNLHRQVIHSSASVGVDKAASAAQRLRDLNPEVEVATHVHRLTWDNALDTFAGCDVILDGADNFDTRHIASHAAARLGVPHVWASILGFEAQLSVFWAGRGPVYEDLFPAPPPPGSVPSCAQAGVLGPLVGVVGSAMAMEALKIITGLGEPMVGRLGYYDSLTGTWEYVPVVADDDVLALVLRAEPRAGPRRSARWRPGRWCSTFASPRSTPTSTCRVLSTSRSARSSRALPRPSWRTAPWWCAPGACAPPRRWRRSRPAAWRGWPACAAA